MGVQMDLRSAGYFFNARTSLRPWFRAALFLVLSGCAPKAVYRTASAPSTGSGKPVIKELIDFGSLPIPNKGLLPRKLSDGRFTPGEWVAIEGDNLPGNAKISINENIVKAKGYTKTGGLLIQLPTGLDTALLHTLTVQSESGIAKKNLEVDRYIAGSDTEGNLVRFLKMNRRVRGYVEDDQFEVSQERPLYSAFSDDGGVLYSVGLPDEKAKKGKGRFPVEIAAIHLGAPEKPELVASKRLNLDSRVTDISACGENRLAILAVSDFALFDVENPLSPKLIAGLSLPGKDDNAMFVEVACVDNGKKAGVLDAERNLLQLIDLSQPEKPKLLNSFKFHPEDSSPLALDMINAEEGGASEVWVLLGPSLRRATRRTGGLLSDAKKNISKFFKRKEDDPPSEKPSSEKKQERPSGKVHELARMDLSGETPDLKQQIKLSDTFYSLRLFAEKDGNLLISGVDRDGLDFSNDEDDKSAIKALWERIKKTSHFGRVVAVDKSTGTSTVKLKGLTIFMDMSKLPDNRLVYSGFHLTGTISFPYVAAAWGTGVEERGFFSQRKLSWKMIFPPYTYGQVRAQP